MDLVEHPLTARATIADFFDEPENLDDVSTEFGLPGDLDSFPSD